jgi:hypothetical protein
MKTTKSLLTVLIFGLVLAAGTAFADDNQLSGLTAQWWQLMFSIPTSANPLVDVTGVDCIVGQRGPVWFLAGPFSGGSATRTCSIPEGEWLFFPIVNNVFFNTPNCGQSGQNFSAEYERSLVAPFINAATNLSVSVDGHPIGDVVRVKSVVFAVTFPPDNIYGPNACNPGVGLAAGSYSPSIDDGYYTLLPPLSLGTHTLHIHGEVPPQQAAGRIPSFWT